jgi:tetratricopeptide (TPR) repeat protein
MRLMLARRSGSELLVATTSLALAAATLGACQPRRSAAGAKVEANLAVIESEETPEKLLDRGKAFARAGDMTRAEQYLAAALEQGADARQVLPLLLRVCLTERRYRVAIDYAEDHLRKHPNDAQLRFVVGTLYSTVGEVQPAKQHLEQAAEASPKNAEVQFALGVLYRDELEDRASAHEHFQAYLRLAPNGPHADEARGSLLKVVPSP